MPLSPSTMYKEILKTDLSAFIQRSFIELNGGTPYVDNWHITLIAQWLERVRLGLCKRLIINIPPRHLKSHIASVAFPAWILGQDPRKRLMCVSYAQDLSEYFARQSLDLMQSTFYQSIFETRLASGRQSAADFATTQRGERLSTSTAGVVTGRGGDFVIIDDPLKAEDVESDKIRTQVNKWFDRTLRSRLNSFRRGAYVIVMQRLHADDFVAHIQQKDKWEVLNLPALAVNDETHVITTPYGVQTVHRREGEALNPGHMSAEDFISQRDAIGSFIFAAQYQQDPEPPEGLVVKRDTLRFYGPHEKPGSFTQIIQSWDTANKTTDTADYSVCTTWGRLGEKQMYLLDVFRRRLDFPALKKAVLAQAERHKADIVLIEDAGSGTGALAELRADNFTKVEEAPARKNPKDGKWIRLSNQTAKIANGFVLLPTSAPWLQEYIHELTSFPNAKYDDQVDSTVFALEWIDSHPAELPALRWSRMMIAADKSPASSVSWIRVRPPAWDKSSTLYLSYPDEARPNRHTAQVNREADGTFIVTQAEFDSFKRDGWTIVEKLNGPPKL